MVSVERGIVCWQRSHLVMPLFLRADHVPCKNMGAAGGLDIISCAVWIDILVENESKSS